MELPKISNNLHKRIMSAGILIPAALIILHYGGFIYNTTIILVAIIMSFEWHGIITSTNDTTTNKKQHQKWQTYGIIYISIFTSSLIFLRSTEGGTSIILVMLTLVWTTDIAAYFAGSILKGPKIYPAISPNKTWAGLIGGMCAASIVGSFASVFIHSLGTIQMILIGGSIAVISQAGDFLESWIKRKFNVKDSGNIIPGHGGIMDRVDGLTTVAPIFAIFAFFKDGNIF